MSCKDEGGTPDAPEPSRRRLASLLDGPEPNGVVRVNANHQKRVKLLSAVIGASAVVAVGAVGVAVANEQAGTGTVGSGPEVTLGATTTTTTPPAAPVTSIAVPVDKATPPAGFR